MNPEGVNLSINSKQHKTVLTSPTPTLVTAFSQNVFEPSWYHTCKCFCMNCLHSLLLSHKYVLFKPSAKKHQADGVPSSLCRDLSQSWALGSGHRDQTRLRQNPHHLGRN